MFDDLHSMFDPMSIDTFKLKIWIAGGCTVWKRMDSVANKKARRV